MGLIRFLHSTVRCQSLNKSSLALLRKKTGFAFADIRKALDLNENDVTKAEEWLKQQAKELGWNKVFKVQDRCATQGLIAIAVEKKKLAMVEVNCETDFVARNDKFKSLVKLVARTCLQQPLLKSREGSIQKMEYNKTELENLKAEKDCLGDHLALLIGSIGENMTLKRAICFEPSQNDIDIAVAVHPPLENSNILLGKFGAFIAFRRNLESKDDSMNLPVDLCKHIIGMNPKKIGELDYVEETDENNPEVNDNETELLKQTYVFDDTITVGQLLEDSGVEVLEFKRYGCGELDSEETESQSKESVEKTAEVN